MPSLNCLAVDPNTAKWHTLGCVATTLGFVCEDADACPNDPVKVQPEICGCGISDLDDADSVGARL